MNREKLIELVKENEVLYDQSNKFYNDSERKEIVWLSIASILKQTPDNCKQQWNCLRDSFRRCLKKRKASSQTGSVPKKWKFEDEMKFLLPHLRERETITPSFSSTENNDQSTENCINEDDNSDELLNDQPQPKQVEKRYKEISRVHFKRKENNNSTLSTIMNYIINERKKENEDEIGMFFACMAKTVKNFSSMNKALAKQRVFSVISELEVSDLEEKESTQTFKLEIIN